MLSTKTRPAALQGGSRSRISVREHRAAATTAGILYIIGTVAEILLLGPSILAVFGSEPGEPDYSPLWAETILTWKAGSKPVLIKSDNQVNKLEKTSGLTERPGHVVLNCPIVKVG